MFTTIKHPNPKKRILHYLTGCLIYCILFSQGYAQNPPNIDDYTDNYPVATTAPFSRCVATYSHEEIVNLATNYPTGFDFEQDQILIKSIGFYNGGLELPGDHYYTAYNYNLFSNVKIYIRELAEPDPLWPEKSDLMDDTTGYIKVYDGVLKNTHQEGWQTMEFGSPFLYHKDMYLEVVIDYKNYEHADLLGGQFGGDAEYYDNTPSIYWGYYEDETLTSLTYAGGDIPSGQTPDEVTGKPTVKFNFGDAVPIRPNPISPDPETNRELYPLTRDHDYSRWESIYLQSEIGKSGYISSIGFYKEWDNAYYPDNDELWYPNFTNIKIYIRHTPETELYQDSWSWNSAELVYEGVVLTAGGGGWQIIKLSQPFYYDNIDNLQIGIEHDYQYFGDEQYKGQLFWGYDDLAPNNRTRYAVDDQEMPEVLDPVTGRPSLVLDINCVVVNAGTDTAFCESGSIQLGASPTVLGPGSSYSYDWVGRWTAADMTIYDQQVSTAANPSITVEGATTTFSLYVTSEEEGCEGIYEDEVTAFVCDEMPEYRLNKGGIYTVTTTPKPIGTYIEYDTDPYFGENKDYTVTFYPCAFDGDTSETVVKLYLRDFSAERGEPERGDINYLKIYDGPDTINCDLLGYASDFDAYSSIISSHRSGALTFVFHTAYYSSAATLLDAEIYEVERECVNPGEVQISNTGNNCSPGSVTLSLINQQGACRFVEWEKSVIDQNNFEPVAGGEKITLTNISTTTHFRAKIDTGSPPYYYTNVVSFNTGNKYYVNDNSTANDIWCTAIGDSGNDGFTPATPKASIAEIFTDPNITLKACDIIYVDDGDYYDEAVTIDLSGHENGTNYLQIIGAGDDKTIINSDNIHFNLYGTSYIKIKNIGMKNLGTSDGIIAIDGSHDIYIEECYLEKNTGSNIDMLASFAVNPGSVTITACSLVNNSSSDKAIQLQGQGSDLLIENNTITGGGIGILLDQPSSSTIAGNTLSGFNSNGIEITTGNGGVQINNNNNITGGITSVYLVDGTNCNIAANTLSGFSYAGVKVDQGNGLGISGNTVSGNTRGFSLENITGSDIDSNTITVTDIGIYLYQSGTLNLFNNRINGGNTGIFLDATSSSSIYNNFFANSITGLEVYTSSCTNNNLYFNSFYNPGNNVMFADANSISGWDVQNNIFYTTSANSFECCMKFGNASTSYKFDKCDYNQYYLPNGAVVSNYGSVSYATLGDWQGVSHAIEGNDVHSIDSDPEYVFPAAGDLRTSALSLGYQSAIYLAGVTADIDGVTRPLQPTIGAAEGLTDGVSFNYANLSKKLDGGYNLITNGKLRFSYVEEYNPQPGEKLQYTIYDPAYAVVAEQGDVSQWNETIKPGVNFYSWNIFSDAEVNFLEGVFYLLEVKNAKNETWVLRFKKQTP